jgi:serine protease
VAPEAELYIVRVFEGEDSLFTASSLVAAMDECEKGGADIINLSLGGPNSSSAEKAVVEDLARRGIQVVAASGNSGFASNVQEFPAGYPAVISVGAVDKDRNIADFSTNNDQVDVAAPGVDILSLTESCSSCYGKFSGTSMASPHVAGVFALLMSKYPDKSIAEIREALEESPMDKGACGIDKVYGHGIVDVMAAAAYLDNGGGAAPELAECVEVTVTVGSDKWGSETFYLIKNEAGEIVYRGGPYKNNIETNSEQFSLPSGCYDFFLLDAFGKIIDTIFVVSQMI